MLRPELRDLKGGVGLIDNFLLHTVDLVSENEGIAPAGCGLEFLQFHGVFRLLDAQDGITVGAKTSDGFQRVIAMLPRHAVLGPER